jgi:hypothetical protein
VPINGDAHRNLESGRAPCAIDMTGVSRGAGEDADVTGRGDDANDVVAAIGNVEIAPGVEGESCGEPETRRGSLAVNGQGFYVPGRHRARLPAVVPVQGWSPGYLPAGTEAGSKQDQESNGQAGHATDCIRPAAKFLALASAPRTHQGGTAP